MGTESLDFKKSSGFLSPYGSMRTSVDAVNDPGLLRKIRGIGIDARGLAFKMSYNQSQRIYR